MPGARLQIHRARPQHRARRGRSGGSERRVDVLRGIARLMIVMKFGGTSVESAAALERVAGIVKSRLDRKPVVVVSAMGKTTNRLLEIANLAVSGKQIGALTSIEELRKFHERESVGLGVEAELERHFSELAELIKGL